MCILEKDGKCVLEKLVDGRWYVHDQYDDLKKAIEWLIYLIDNNFCDGVKVTIR